MLRDAAKAPPARAAAGKLYQAAAKIELGEMDAGTLAKDLRWLDGRLDTASTGAGEASA